MLAIQFQELKKKRLWLLVLVSRNYMYSFHFSNLSCKNELYTRGKKYTQRVFQDNLHKSKLFLKKQRHILIALEILYQCMYILSRFYVNTLLTDLWEAVFSNPLFAFYFEILKRLRIRRAIRTHSQSLIELILWFQKIS